MKWITKVRYHLKMAKLYMLLLRDEYKTRYPHAYEFGDKKWRYHMKRSMELTQNHLNEKKDKAA